jgi:hypothetical protein
MTVETNEVLLFVSWRNANTPTIINLNDAILFFFSFASISSAQTPTDMQGYTRLHKKTSGQALQQQSLKNDIALLQFWLINER